MNTDRTRPDISMHSASRADVCPSLRYLRQGSAFCKLKSPLFYIPINCRETHVSCHIHRQTHSIQSAILLYMLAWKDLRRFHVLTAASMKTVFWDVVPCSEVEIDRRFRGAYYRNHQDQQSACSVTAGKFDKSLHFLSIFLARQLIWQQHVATPIFPTPIQKPNQTKTDIGMPYGTTL
jgi:hypothetical protein